MHTLVTYQQQNNTKMYRTFSNLIRTNFCRFLKRKKKLVRGSNPPKRQTECIILDVIVRSFKKCCISSALDGSEDDILWEVDDEDKDDSDWVTDSDSVISDDGESDE